MPKVLTAREVDQLLKSGGLAALPADAILTPSARDSVAEFKRSGSPGPGPIRSVPRGSGGRAPVRAEPSVPDFEYRWAAGSDPRTPEAIAAFFRSPAIEVLKERMCDIGRRLWQREYTDGNGGNITIRVGDNLALCTPTLICKGFMTPADMCLVDLDGNQLAGTRKRTSEAMTHFGIMKRQPAAKSCVHAHPPHATAFAIANVEIPTCLIPEAEVFLGKIGIAEYQTPGTPANADAVGEVGRTHQAVLMKNHGVITWGKDVEDAYWKMENIDSYCRTIWIAAGLGGGLHRFSGSQARELVELRQKLGMPDARADLKECELCDSASFRPTVVCDLPARESSSGNGSTAPADPDVEAVVKQVTDAIMRQLGAGAK